MAYPHFENWLFSDDELTPEQAKALAAELERSPALRQTAEAWAEVESLLVEAPEIAPASGFSARFQQRLANQAHHKLDRQAWLLFLLFIGGAALIALVFGLQILSWLSSPAGLLNDGFQQFLLAWRQVALYGNLAQALIDPLPDFVPLAVGFMLAASIGWLVLIWMATLLRFTVAPRRA